MKQIDLTPFFKTKMQASDFSTRLSHITEHLYDVDFNLDKMLFDTYGMAKKDKFMVLLRENDVSTEKVDALKTFFTNLQAEVAKLPVIDMTIGFEPKESTLAALTDWFVINMKHQILLTITIDKNIIAGAKINYNGKFLDASIKPIFDKILAETFQVA